MKRHILWLSVCLAALIGGGCATPSGERTTKIYNESADGSKMIAAGVARAKKENKRVLLQFGANWSEGCHRLHTLLVSDPALAQEIQKEYVWLLIDRGEGRNAEVNEQYENPTRLGYPALVILDATGKQVVSTGADEFGERGEQDPVKLLTFLQRWGPTK
jgi:thiol:disulfide interchange protein